MSGASLITINFASTDRRLAVRLRAVLAVAVVILLAVGGILVWQARNARAGAADADRRIQELSASEAKLRPVLEERQQIVRNLAAMTGLVEARRFSWTRLLSGIEAAFPSGAALSRIEVSVKDHVVSLEGIAQSPEALSSLMIGLGRSASFKSPLLKRQSMDKGILSFNVSVIYQETMVADHPQEPVRRPGR